MLIDVEELYKKYGPMVMRRCRMILKNEEQAKQAMQDVFVKILKNQHKLDAKYPSSLLYRIATNTCLNTLRDKKMNVSENSEELINRIPVQEQNEARLTNESILKGIFANEKESTRTIVYLFYVDGLSWEEISQTVGLSISGVRKRVRLFKKKIKPQKEVFYGN
jgi:RNA polymerase sigma-70 factor, ECF subfamily